MTLIIEISGQLEAALKAQAQAQGISPSGYASHLLEQALASQAEQPSKPKKSALGLWSQYGPGPTEEEIDENRREMFRNFGEDAPEEIRDV